MSEINITFIMPDGTEVSRSAKIGSSVLDVAHNGEKLLEGACEGSLACSTCHVILPESQFTSFPEASEDEEDMLDLAFGLEKTSRLGCQLILTKDMDGFKFKIPSLSKHQK